MITFNTFCRSDFQYISCINLVAFIFTMIRFFLIFYAFPPYYLLQCSGLSIFIFNSKFLSERPTFLFMANFSNKMSASFKQTLSFLDKLTHHENPYLVLLAKLLSICMQNFNCVRNQCIFHFYLHFKIAEVQLENLWHGTIFYF